MLHKHKWKDSLGPRIFSIHSSINVTVFISGGAWLFVFTNVAYLLLQAGDAEAVVIGWVQELTQDPTSLCCLGGKAVSHALAG